MAPKRSSPSPRATLPVDVRTLDALGVAVCLADARDDLPLVYVNPAFEALTGWPAAEALGRNCRFLQGAGTEAGAVRKLREAIARGAPCRVTVRNYRRDG